MPPAVVGRETELARLRELLASARNGTGGALLLSGPPGSGKSTVLNTVAGEASDAQVLGVTGLDAEVELPFAALDVLLRPLLDRRGELLEVHAESLERALALVPGGAADPFVLGAAVTSLLALAAADAPVLVIVDDAQWLDPPSLVALRFALRRLSREAVAFALATRAGTLPELRVERLELAPLDREAALAILDAATGGAIAPEPAEQLLAAGAGNPLVLRELAAQLSPGELAGTQPLIGPPRPGTHAEALLGARIAALDPAARFALLVAATSERDDHQTIVAGLRAAGADATDLAGAEHAGLLALQRGRVTFSHPLVRSVAYHGQPAEARRRSHAALAAALGPADPRRPWHAAAAAVAPDEAVATELEALAADTRRRGAHATAARTWRRAAEVTPGGEARVRRLLEAARDFERAGALGEARAQLEEAGASGADGAILARLRGLHAALDLAEGHPARARDALRAEARRLTAAGQPAAASVLSLQAALAAMLLGDVPGWERDAAAAGAGLASDAMRAAALVAAGRAAEAVPLFDAVLDRVTGPDAAPALDAADVLALAAHALVWIERFDDADALLDRLVGDARELSAVGALPYLLGVRAALDLRLGRWTRAAAAADEAVEMAEAAGRGSYLAGGLGVRAVVRAWRGEADGASADADAALELVPEAAPRLAVFPHQARGVLALSRGDAVAAAEHFRAASAAHTAAGIVEPGSMPWQADLIETLWAAGEDADAHALLTEWEAGGERALVRATAARLRALRAPGAQLDAAFADALAAHGDLPMPFERARTLLLYGERLRRVRRKADCRPPLRQAVSLFDSLGAPQWAARARRELRAAGANVPAVDRPASAELTPQELQVALLVAEGRTNREVGAALFSSPKTVEHHLSSIYRKLGVRRRTELNRAMSADLATVLPS